MEKREQIKVKSGAEYDSLFPKAILNTIVKKEGASVGDTIRFIPKVVRDTLFHTEKISKLLKRNSVPETCKAIWHFVYDHIAYRKDEDGKEQIRSPARTWHDRGNAKGVDCDCYTVFISSILSNLKIKHALRITKYKENHFQHIYPIVPLPDGSYITIDCVVKNFNYEEPYTEKKDTKMDLEYLNGITDANNNKNSDAIELLGIYEDKEAMAELGKIFKRKTNDGGTGKKKVKLKEVLKKGLYITNRLNPATAMLRAGILASAKLNIMKIGQRLKYAYLSEEEAKKRNIDMNKFARLKKVREKLEQIFYGAGGKPENLKKAIISGRGNKNNDVSGLGYTPDLMEGMNANTPVSTLLGDIYENEMVEVNGLGELGEPATAATIAAASGVMGAIAGLLKSIGNIFPPKDKAATDFSEGDASSTTENEAASNTNLSNDENTKGDSSDENEKKLETGKRPSYWDNNKKWIKPVGIGIGSLGLLYAGFRLITGKKKQTAAKPAFSGIPKSIKKQRGGKTKVKSKKHKKEAIELL